MPASSKMLKSREQAKNRAAGVGDKDGKMPHKPAAVQNFVNCTVCCGQLKMSKSNIDAKIHCESKHPGVPFAQCFPGQFDPTAPVEVAVAEKPVAQVQGPGKAKKVQDMSFLQDALTAQPAKKGGKK
jgi:hypothetical protein